MRVGGDLVVSVTEIEGGARLEVGHHKRILVVLTDLPDVGEREDARHHTAVAGQKIGVSGGIGHEVMEQAGAHWGGQLSVRT